MSDAADAIERYRAFLQEASGPGAGVEAFPIDALDRLGVPVWSASVLGPLTAHGAGYGATAGEAERGALGEAVEALAAKRYAATVRPRRLTLAQALEAGAIDPARLSLPLGVTVAPGQELLWVPARRSGGEPCLVPLEAAVTTASEWRTAAEGSGVEAPLFTPITNGMGAGAGADMDRAVSHGLNELLQRDLNWPSFKALDTGRAVDPGAVAPDLVEGLAAAGFEVRLKYSGHAFGVHAFHAAGVDKGAAAAVSRTATGEGADRDPLVAGRKALLELCSSRCRKAFFFGGEDALRVASAPYREWVARQEQVASAREAGIDLAARFDALLGTPETLERVVARITQAHETVPLAPAYPAGHREAALADAGLEVLVVDLTGPEDAAQVAHVIVPGLEAEVLSHHRIGPRALERLQVRCPHAVHHGPAAPGPGWAPAPAAPGVGAAPAWVDAAWLRELTEAYFPLYREPDRHTYVAAS